MRNSRPREIVAMTVAWAGVLLLVQYVLGRTAAHPEADPAFTTPRIGMFVKHVGCTEQYKEVVRALEALPWAGETRVERSGTPIGTTSPEATPAPHTMSTVPPEQRVELCGVRVLTEVKSVEQADLMQVHDALRALGVVPLDMEFGGLPHFALQARMADLSCAPCVAAALEALKPFPVSATYYYSTTSNPVEVSKQLTFQWLESRSVDTAQNAITVAVLPGRTARVSELIRSLERAGFLPSALRIVVDKG
jgi:hypothetical protein